MAEFEDQFDDPFDKNTGEDENQQVEYIPHIFSCRNFRLAVAHEEMNSRRRNTMEDCHRILTVLDEALPTYSYIGIYDGHGGRQIVDFLENSLERIVAQELKLDDSASIEERLTRAFLITDMESRKLNITTSGATGVVALLSHSPEEEGESRKLIVANVGDSRAVLVSSKPASNLDEAGVGGFTAHRLSYDHKADDASEQKRIAAAGGFVSRNRVLGILAVSRSFGDHGMKDFVTGDSIKHGYFHSVISCSYHLAQPYISVTNIKDHGNCPILILACDGVWDVFTDQEAADLLLERYLKEGPFDDASQYLVNTAIEKGSADNVTAVVVFL